MKLKKIILMCTLVLGLLLFDNQFAFASGLESSIAVTGTKKLLDDLTKVLMGLSAAVSILTLIIQRIRMQIAENEEVGPIKKWERRIVISGISVFLISGLFNLILAYYK